jgi:hypothetical protein
VCGRASLQSVEVSTHVAREVATDLGQARRFARGVERRCRPPMENTGSGRRTARAPRRACRPRQRCDERGIADTTSFAGQKAAGWRLPGVDPHHRAAGGECAEATQVTGATPAVSAGVVRWRHGAITASDAGTRRARSRRHRAPAAGPVP